MIDLTVMHFLLTVVFTIITLASRGLQQSTVTISVSNLQPGQVVQGAVPIQGTVQAEQFAGYEVLFGYDDDNTGTWFLIDQASQTVQDGLLATWDTTLITDGDYRLRVLLKLVDGTSQEYLVAGLKVRNYTPIEQSIEQAVAPTNTLQPSPVRMSTQGLATGTPFAANPGSVTKIDFQSSILRGAGFTVFIFILIGIYLSFKKLSQRR